MIVAIVYGVLVCSLRTQPYQLAENSTTVRNCSLYYSWNNGDSCVSIARRFLILPFSLKRLNPGLDCSSASNQGRQVGHKIYF